MTNMKYAHLYHIVVTMTMGVVARTKKLQPQRDLDICKQKWTIYLSCSEQSKIYGFMSCYGKAFSGVTCWSHLLIFLIRECFRVKPVCGAERLPPRHINLCHALQHQPLKHKHKPWPCSATSTSEIEISMQPIMGSCAIEKLYLLNLYRFGSEQKNTEAENYIIFTITPHVDICQLKTAKRDKIFVVKHCCCCSQV